MADQRPADACVTRLVLDVPADKDALGPHERIAATLADLIRNEDGGMTVGLVGDYGSGKSTVMRLLERKFGGADDVVFWTFNAWAHEGDPLRRTFLESLIDRLTEANWINKEAWKEEKERLAFRSREVTTRTIPRLEWLGVAFALSLLATPFGLALLTDALRDGFRLWPPAPIHMAGTVGALLTLLPAVIVLCVLVPHIFRRYFRRPRGHQAEPLQARIGVLLVDKGRTESNTKTLETTEPTSIEFERKFRDLLEEALSKQGRRVVLVIDNLDRVDAHDALRLWSTLRTFIDQGSHPHSTAWLKLLWVVVPYDARAIRRLWEAERPRGEPDQHDDDPAAEDVDVPASFLEKSIQLRFEVPAPMLADWREYLVVLLREALPQHEDAEFRKISRIVAMHRRDQAKAPTPRELKIIVNQIGALHRSRGHEIPLEVLSYYIVLQLWSDGRIVQRILEGALPTAGLERLVRADVRQCLAALAFGVNVAAGRQLLLEERIRKALESGDTASLRKMADGFTGFRSVFDVALAKAMEEWKAAEPEGILHAAAALEGLGDSLEAPDASGIFAAVESIERILPLDDLSIRGFRALVKLNGSTEFAERLWQRFSRAIEEGDPFDADNPAEAVARSYLAVVTALKETGVRELEPVTIPGDLESFSAMILALDAHDAQEWQIHSLRPLPDSAELTGTLSKTIESGQFHEPQGRILSILQRGQPGIDRSALAGTIGTRLDSERNASTDEVGPLLLALLRMGDPAKDCLQALGRKTDLAHHAYTVRSDEHIAGRAAVVAVFLMFAPDDARGGVASASARQARSNARETRAILQGASLIRSAISSPTDPLVQEIGHIFMYEIGLDRLVRIIDRKPDAWPLIGAIFARAAEDPAFDQCFTPPLLGTHWPFLAEHIKQPRAFLRRLSQRGELSQYVQGQPFDGRLSQFYEWLLDGRREDRALWQWCVEQLRSLDRDAWREAFATEGGTSIDLARWLFDEGYGIDLEQAFREVLEEHALGAMGGTAIPKSLKGAELVALLEDSQRTLFRDTLIRKLYGAHGEAHELLFIEFGRDLAESPTFRTDDRTATDILEAAIDHNLLPTLRWLDQTLTANPKIFERMTREYVEVMRQAVRRRLVRDPETEIDRVISGIARALRVRRSRKQPHGTQGE